MNVKGNTTNTKSVNKHVTFGIIQDSSILLYNFLSRAPVSLFTTLGYMLPANSTIEVDQHPGESSILRALSPGYKATGNP